MQRREASRRKSVDVRVKLTSTLIAPTGGNGGTFTGSFGTFNSGVATDTAFNWDEVGIISLRSSILDADYLGAGDVIVTSGTYDQFVGRFIPASCGFF
ncbi:DUF6701 domain-containing protein [Noviherbaspirillum sp.]|uniref:DUF6701 domain-containing protein n=1 Tax=Noviherbaspirillum sp. TaxID=1926288 RepID=UPI0039C9AF7D